jgi:hypothetical protein
MNFSQSKSNYQQAGGLAQAVECLFVKCEKDLSSNSGTVKKRKKKRIPIGII